MQGVGLPGSPNPFFGQQPAFPLNTVSLSLQSGSSCRDCQQWNLMIQEIVIGPVVGMGLSQACKNIS